MIFCDFLQPEYSTVGFEQFAHSVVSNAFQLKYSSNYTKSSQKSVLSSWWRWYHFGMKIVVNRTNKKVLKICPQIDGSVNVVAYKFLSQKRIADYVAENIQWINSRIQTMSAKAHATALPAGKVGSDSTIRGECENFNNQFIKDVFAGKSFLLCGQVYKCVATTQSQTHLKDDCLFICEKQFATRELRLKAICGFLKRMSNIVLSQQVSKLGSEMALCPTKIQFKDLHGRWCSCADAESRAIVLDYRLIQLPQQLQNYVITHAFVHFRKQSHTAEFFNYLSNSVPNYKQLQNTIADYNFLLDV